MSELSPLTELTTVMTPAIAVFFAMLAYFVKRLINQMDKLENTALKFMTREDVRILIEDKQKPLEVALASIDQRLRRIESELAVLILELRENNGKR